MLRFVNNVKSDINTDAFVAIITGINEQKEDLLNELKEKLLFPDYFGNNWDALYDCLCDLSWISKSKISLLHKDLPKIDNKSLVIYLNILVDAIATWEPNKNKIFEVIFEIKDEIKVKELLCNK
ncbi:barstar family protein [Alkaliflexus imshenetskii]|uniref:barstar family protein n=1 Tax=Alkaliflexus imshenetskii TaxID=286730 RepID=UPI00047D890F|nr:barstar family protein [Alkaliflexus imshenetskii]